MTKTLWQLLKYGLSGGLAFVVDFGLLWLLGSCFHIHYLIAAALSYLVGLAITYSLSVLWIFDEHRLANQLAELSIFALIGAAGLALTQLSMWFFTDWVFGRDLYLLSKIVTTVLVSLFNFVLKKYILFTK